MHFVIRNYKSLDKEAITLRRYRGMRECIYPAFFKAMSHLDHIGMTLSMLRTGQELLFCGAVGGLLYSCCQQLHHFLSQPNNSFWVAETMVNSQSKIPGMVGVLGKKGNKVETRWKQGGNIGNGGHYGDHGSYGETLFSILLCHSYSTRRPWAAGWRSLSLTSVWSVASHTSSWRQALSKQPPLSCSASWASSA
ncbi:hypothetical protein Z043_120888, partial [Scleropages formosus]